MPDITVVVAGEAGLGVKSAGSTLSRYFARSGYHVFAYPDVMSRIRGGHNFTRIRVSDVLMQSISNSFDLLLAMDESSMQEHRYQMVERGVVVYEGSGQPTFRHQARCVPLPMQELARRHGGSPAMASVVGIGALFALMGLELEGMESLLRERFLNQGGSAVQQNVECLRAGYAAIDRRIAAECTCQLPSGGGGPRKLLLTGNQAVGYGALAAGVGFFAGYPMSPATAIMEYLAAKQDDFELVVEQVEDEIAALSAVVGAAFAGARAMTATSGGGFSLMVEGLGLAAMIETPVVIVVCQRPGPATGFPTRTEQAELLMAINAAPDEFPRFVFAPGNAAQAFGATFRAFELANRFQVPSIVLSDQQLADSLYTLDGLEPPNAEAPEDFSAHEWQVRPAYTYRRYQKTESGISPRLWPGFREQLVCSMGGEHDESGLPSEDRSNRLEMHSKRMRKMSQMADEFGELTAYPGDIEDCLVLCFGSTYGAVREAVELVRADGRQAGMLHLSEVWPFPRQRVMARLARARQLIVVEQNSEGQLSRLLSQETRARPDFRILKYDGRPFAGAELADQIKAMYKGRV